MAHYLTTILTLLISLLFFSAAIAQTPSSTSTAATTSFTGMPTIVANGGGDRYGYVGCYNETAGLPDTSGARTLSGGGKTFDGIMTVQMCVEYCSKNGNFPFAGVEYSRECWCGHRLSGLATKVADEECDTPCDGDKSQVCGGALRLSVYQQGTATSGGSDLTRVPLTLCAGALLLAATSLVYGLA